MTKKFPFTFLIRPEERDALKCLSIAKERSEGATIRWLIREAAAIEKECEFPSERLNQFMQQKWQTNVHFKSVCPRFEAEDRRKGISNADSL